MFNPNSHSIYANKFSFIKVATLTIKVYIVLVDIESEEAKGVR